ncbi:hypothetical protein N665_0339s0036 [Sinapis alba]|nr:hypothetical protein N665_0339s0036 [Sinapis alba]
MAETSFLGPLVIVPARSTQELQGETLGSQKQKLDSSSSTSVEVDSHPKKSYWLGLFKGPKATMKKKGAPFLLESGEICFHGNLPSRGALHAILNGIWGSKAKDITASKLGPKIVLIRIPCSSTRQKVLNRGIWHIEGQTMFITKWEPSLIPTMLELTEFESGDTHQVEVSCPWLPPTCGNYKEVGHSIRRCPTEPITFSLAPEQIKKNSESPKEAENAKSSKRKNSARRRKEKLRKSELPTSTLSSPEKYLVDSEKKKEKQIETVSKHDDVGSSRKKKKISRSVQHAPSSIAPSSEEEVSSESDSEAGAESSSSKPSSDYPIGKEDNTVPFYVFNVF